MKTVLLAFGDYALVDEDPRNFAVGRPRVRMINGRRSVTIPYARYSGDLATAIDIYALQAPVYVGQVSDGQDMLRKWRRNAGLSQRKLSKLTGVSVSTIREIEHRRSDPRVSTIDKLLSAIWQAGHKNPADIT